MKNWQESFAICMGMQLISLAYKALIQQFKEGIQCF
jgi:carbamoylphosphate synthase small subunit